MLGMEAVKGWGKQALRLYLVVGTDNVAKESFENVIQKAISGGVSCVQLREKNANTRDFIARACTLKKLLQPLGIPLVINDRIDVALACKADGVHLGQSDMSPQDARSLLPPEVFIGWSVETMQHIHQAADLPVDYIALSPIFASHTKTDTALPWGIEGLKRACQQTCLPLVTIGGINHANARSVWLAGADGLAVVSAICAAPDPEAAAALLMACTN